MRTIAYALALAFLVASAAPTCAGVLLKGKARTDCEKVGGMWDVNTNSCLRFG